MRVTEKTFKNFLKNFNESHPELPDVYFYSDVRGRSVRDTITHNMIVVANTMTDCYDLFLVWVAGYETARRVFSLGKTGREIF